MLKLLRCEFIKLRRSKILWVGIAGTFIVPFFVIVNAVTNYFSDPENVISLFSLYDGALMFLMLLFAPMVLTVLGAWIISREYTDGTLKNLFVIPVSRTAFLTGKLLFFWILTFAFMFISWLEILLSAFICGCFLPVTELNVPSICFFLIKMLSGGALLCATQTPFLYLTIRAKGFVMPLIAVAAVSLVNVVLSNSPIAGIYPWAASYLLISGHLSGTDCPKSVSVVIILLMCVAGIVASLRRFGREEVR
ncbi:MAG: ABC transporter permease [Roseburia sp.]|nr:ABC transporter permease [Roseburia sp.]MCM1243693.1 ABC transporter permease [Roseburia sp.]